MTGHGQDDRQAGNTRDPDAATRQEGQQTDLDRGHGVKGQGGQEASRGVPDPEGGKGGGGIDPADAPVPGPTTPGPQGGLAEEFGDLDDDGTEGEGLPGHLGGGMIGG